MFTSRALFSCGLLVAGLLATLGLLLAAPAAGKKFAILVGINKYKHDDLKPLSYAENDAADLAALLEKAGYEVVLLAGAARDKARQPTRANIEKQLHEVLRRCEKGDTVLVGLAGHGLQFEGQTDCFFCPVDARPFADETATLVSLNKVYDEMKKSFAGVKVLLVDACRNDPMLVKKRGVDADSAPRPPKGVAALFSCSAGEFAFETEKLGTRGHGVFFHYVLEGLRGAAKDGDGEVTFDTLSSYVRKNVSRQVPLLIKDGAKQSPNLKADLSGESPVLVKIDNTNSIGMKLVWIPAGTFTMGSPKGEERRADDEEQHKVVITRPFYLGAFEVTQGQYQKVMAENPSHFSPGGGGKDQVKDRDTSNFPVENVSWENAVKFCERLTDLPAERRLGLVYRLPTEAEWEYACRGEVDSAKPFYFGSALSSRQANFDGGFPCGGASKGPCLLRTAEVGSYQANAFGLFDMHGNVCEWCSDWYGKDYYQNSPRQDPKGPASGSERVIRGGGWHNYGWYCRAATRYPCAPRSLDYSLGFRAAAVPSGK